MAPLTLTARTEFLHRALAAARAARTPALRFNPVIAAAQAALESNWGRSQLATRANNIKGVKAGRSWRGEVLELPTREQRPDGSWYTTVARWRVYRDWAHAFEDYGALIERVYPHAALVADDPRAFLEALVSGTLRYATDLDYVSKVWRIVEQFTMLQVVNNSPQDVGYIILYDATGKEVARTPIPEGATVLARADLDRRRYHVRPDAGAKE